jgi:hypothetical protein
VVKTLTLGDIMWLPPSEGLMAGLSKPSRKLLGDFLRRPQVLWAGSKSNYLAKKLLEETLGAVGFTSPTNTYFGLWTAALDDTSTGSTGSEATYGAYARTLIGTANNQTDAWNAATGTTTATVTNKNVVTFPTSTLTANTLTYIGCTDASTAGNMLLWASLTASVMINPGDTPKVNAAAFSVVDD